MFSKILFPIIRALELLTLIPIWGMLAWFVHQYEENNSSVPARILVLFIASLVATFWAIVSFFQFHHSIGISMLVFIVDMLILGGLIAGVVFLRDIRNEDCSTLSVPVGIRYGDDEWSWDNGEGWSANIEKRCMMLKSAWALGIVDCVLFFISAFLALLIYRRNERVAVRRKGYVVEDRRPVRRRGWF
ncbi:hypothetical protein BDZ91DRAFT_716485 [Kalaharituber pfeilii]|nr:hypothetical protein BDZ91DRAFT_716485 [Kalaharituber pfeilii]